MRAMSLVVLSALGSLVAGCESAPERGEGATAAVVQAPRCEGAPTTGSRIARCDNGNRVGVISGEEVRTMGMPSSGSGKGAETRGGQAN